MQVQVPAEQVNQEIATRLKELSRTARLKGFRPGKAPITVIRQQFGQQVHREVIGELMQSSFAEAVTQNQLSPAGSPRIEPTSGRRGPGSDLCRNLRGLPRSVAAADRGAFHRASDRRGHRRGCRRDDRAPAQAADEVHTGLSARGRGRQGYGGFRRLDRRQCLRRRQGGGRCHRARRGTHARATRARAAGASAGESREIGVDFPADYRATELAGKHAVFKVDVKSVEEPALPALDDEFCTGFGVTEGGVARLARMCARTCSASSSRACATATRRR
jgi:trigger factor